MDWRSSRLREVFPPIKANDVKPFIFMISTFRKKPWFRHEIEKTILCRILRNCVALSSGNAAACYLPDVTVACRHLKLRGGGTPNCLFSKRYWRVPTRDRDMAITPGGDRTQAVRFPARRAAAVFGAGAPGTFLANL